MSIDYNGQSQDSFGGSYQIFENGINLNDFSQDGALLFSLSSPDTTEAALEIKDTTGEVQRFRIVGLTSEPQTYRLDLGLIRDADPARVREVVFVLAGQGPRRLNVEWGTYQFTPGIQPNPDADTALTPAPATSPGAFASGTAADPTAQVSLNVASETFLTADYSGESEDSFGGVYFSHSDPVDLNTIARDGAISFRLDSPSLQQIGFEVKDASGNVQRFDLSGLQSFGQVYSIPLSQLTEVDATAVREMVFVIAGGGQHRLNVDWGNYLFTPGIPPNAASPNLTPVPETVPGTFASGTAANPTAEIALNIASETFLSANYSGSTAESFGGVYLSYPQGIDLNTVAQNGQINFRIDSPDLSQVGFEIKDVNGQVQRFNLFGVQNFGQVYSIGLNQLTSIDPANVSELVFVIPGSGQHQLNVDWGLFNFTPSIPPDTSAAAAITPVPRVTPGTFASGSSADPTASVNATLASPTFLTVNYNGETDDSFGGLYLLYPNGVDLNDVAQNGRIGFRLDSPDLESVGLEVKDLDGKVQRFTLSGVEEFGQIYSIALDQMTEVDTSRVSEVVLVLTGRGTRRLNLDWGRFNFTPDLEPQP
jgi:outer membrane lipoprotein-sorting protein